jgi:hypothetical protein
VQNLSFIVDYFFWHTNTFGFHFTNLLLHAGSAVALFFLLQRILRSVLKPEWLESSFISNLAFFAALLWAVHPVHSAAVDYISGRADSLAFVFAATWLDSGFLRPRAASGGHPHHPLPSGRALRVMRSLFSRDRLHLVSALYSAHLVFRSANYRAQQDTYARCRCPDLRCISDLATITSASLWRRPVARLERSGSRRLDVAGAR